MFSTKCVNYNCCKLQFIQLAQCYFTWHRLGDGLGSGGLFTLEHLIKNKQIQEYWQMLLLLDECFSTFSLSNERTNLALDSLRAYSSSIISTIIVIKCQLSVDCCMKRTISSCINCTEFSTQFPHYQIIIIISGSIMQFM